MSLINQMLKEIDERGREQSERGRSTSVYEAGRQPLAPWLFMLMGIVASAMIVLVIILLLRPSAEVDDVQVVRSEVSPLVTETLSESAGDAPDPLNEGSPELMQQAVSIEPATETSGDSQQQEPSSVERTAVVQAQPETKSQPETKAQPVNEVQEPLAQVQEPSAQIQEPSAQVEEPSAQAPAGEMTIQRTQTAPRQLAERSFQRGLRALEAGRGRDAMIHFNDALSIRPGYVEAREQLAVYYHGQGFLSDALRVLEEGLIIDPEESRYLLLQARILERAEQPEMALEVLRDVAMQLPQNADLLILRGALASELEEFELAVLTYEGLTAWRPQEGRWWLGLAIAYEHTDDILKARQAYRRAQEDPRLASGSRTFIQQRLEAL